MPVQADAVTLTVPDGDGSRVLVEALSFTAPPGALTVITGPSGSGKTSLLMAILGVASIASGRLAVGETSRGPNEIASPAVVSEIGVVFQDYHLIEALSVRDNVALPLRLSGESWRSAREDAARCLASLGIREAQHGHYPAALSGGERQRVAIARGVVKDPDLILADEPSAHLDKTRTAEVGELLARFTADGATVVASSHDPRLIALADHVVELAPQVEERAR